MQTPAYDGGPQLSPDGRWLLHQSNVSGQHEIYVRRHQELDRQWQVSAGGGVTPDGRFIMLRRAPNGGRLRVVVNWTEELKRILAAGGVQ